jgi:hypothetical protein
LQETKIRISGRIEKQIFYSHPGEPAASGWLERSAGRQPGGHFSDCVKFTGMRTQARNLIVLLLCCLLPVQSALAFARSAGMISHHARWLQTAVVTSVADTAPLLMADDAQRHPPQAHHALHAQPSHPPATLSPAGKPAKFVPSAAKSSGHSQASCTDCSKCCLMGAGAPPPAVMQVPAISFVLRTFKPACPEAAGHIPEKPERPPRFSARSLT